MWKLKREKRRAIKAFDAPEFWHSLEDTIAWVEPRVDLGDLVGCLRSPVIAPATLEPTRHEAVRTVVVRRRRPTTSPRKSLLGGRLLVYFPDLDLCDGAAQAESAGLLDMHNAPPHDTWVGLYADDGAAGDETTYLVAWIPPTLVDLVSDGIAVNPEECIRWIEDSGTDLWRLIRDDLVDTTV
jgi:hypothetical protein